MVASVLRLYKSLDEAADLRQLSNDLEMDGFFYWYEKLGCHMISFYRFLSLSKEGFTL